MSASRVEYGKNQTRKCIMVERRKHNRYRLGVPVIFAWRDTRQVQHEGLGLTRDVSIRGAFVLTTSPPALKAKIKLKAFFPPLGRGAVPMRIRGEGRAVRVEAIKHHNAPGGFAVVGERFVLRRGEEY
jgi:hypothetical protein